MIKINNLTTSTTDEIFSGQLFAILAMFCPYLLSYFLLETAVMVKPKGKVLDQVLPHQAWLFECLPKFLVLKIQVLKDNQDNRELLGKN